MAVEAVITSERQARIARRAFQEVDSAVSSSEELNLILQGLPATLIDRIVQSLRTERAHLRKSLEAFEAAQRGDVESLILQIGGDEGALLIAARLRLNLSQKELGRKLGLHEQQIQRYESDRYRSISLSNYKKIASVLGVRLRAELLDAPMSGWSLAANISASDARKVVKHARANGWFGETVGSEEDGVDRIKRYIAENVLKYSTPSMLRAGMNVVEDSNDWLLLAWKARITQLAESIISTSEFEYNPLSVSWISDLIKISTDSNGPRMAVDFLLDKGIVLVVEPCIETLKLDGAAFIVENTPVIGLTIRKDTIDNFWFTLLHELAHIILHYRTGLALGFFDDDDSVSLDEMEREANYFASELLIPEHVWKRAPARIAQKPEPVRLLARKLAIHPAIVFGRIRMERKNYSIFSKEVGQGSVRSLFIQK